METSILSRFQEEKAMRLKGGLYHQTQIKLAYNSNRIEGSTLSEEQTRYIFDTNTVNVNPNESINVDDIIETLNHFYCFDYMIDMAEENLSEEMIKEFHRNLRTGISDSRKEWFKPDGYKSQPNMVVGLETTPPLEVSEAMINLLDSYLETTTVDLAALVDFHYHFEKIHPFQDGNGRVGRIILFKECLKHDIVPFFLEAEDKAFYYQGLKEFEKTPGHLIDICLSAQEKYREMMRNFQNEE